MCMCACARQWDEQNNNENKGKSRTQTENKTRSICLTPCPQPWTLPAPPVPPGGEQPAVTGVYHLTTEIIIVAPLPGLPFVPWSLEQSQVCLGGPFWVNMVRADVAKLSIYHLTGFVPLKANSSLPCHLHCLCPQLSASSGRRGIRILPTLVI